MVESAVLSKNILFFIANSEFHSPVGSAYNTLIVPALEGNTVASATYITQACHMIKLNFLTSLSVDICFIYYTVVSVLTRFQNKTCLPIV